MNENDNILLEKFFQETAMPQLEDSGFSRRVMQQLPRRSTRLTHLWTLFCLTVALVTFVLTQGWTVLVSYAVAFQTNVEVFLHTLPVALDWSVLARTDLFGHVSSAAGSGMSSVLLSLLVLMALTIIGLTRWVSRWVW